MTLAALLAEIEARAERATDCVDDEYVHTRERADRTKDPEDEAACKGMADAVYVCGVLVKKMGRIVRALEKKIEGLQVHEYRVLPPGDPGWKVIAEADAALARELGEGDK